MLRPNLFDYNYSYVVLKLAITVSRENDRTSDEYNRNLSVCYYNVKYNFQSESTLYSLLVCHGTPSLEEAPYLKFIWQQRVVMGSNLVPVN